MKWVSNTPAPVPPHLSDQQKPHQVAQDRNGEDQQLTPPCLAQLSGEHIYGGCHQAFHTNKLWNRGRAGEGEQIGC